MAETPLHFPEVSRQRLEPHLPPTPSPSRTAPSPSPTLPFVTLTFATSLDSALALGPGIRTALSGPQSKAMTHYLRSRHDAICVGVGTAVADDPGLNSRLAVTHAHAQESGEASSSICDATGVGGASASDGATTAHQPRPIIIDPRLRWDFTAQSKVMRLAREGSGLAPYIVTLETEPPTHKKKILEEVGGKFIVLRAGRGDNRFDWRAILSAVRQEGLRSIMIEGGGDIINSLLSENAGLVDSVIVTIAPIWLGRGGVTVSPARTLGADRPVARLSNTTWIPLGDDVVLCGRIAQ